MKSQNKKIIAETEKLQLVHNYELTYLIKKSDNEILLEDDFYGDPTCGLIDKENKWAIVAGTHLTLWIPNAIIKYANEQFKDIHAIRLKNKQTVEILTDPWSEFSAVWELNIDTQELKKKADFDKYRGKAYKERIDW